MTRAVTTCAILQAGRNEKPGNDCIARAVETWAVVYRGGGGDCAPSQIRGGKCRCGKFRGPPWILCGNPRQSPQCVLPVCEKFAGNPGFRVGNLAINFKREISHAKLKWHESPPPSVAGCTAPPSHNVFPQKQTQPTNTNTRVSIWSTCLQFQFGRYFSSFSIEGNQHSATLF